MKHFKHHYRQRNMLPSMCQEQRSRGGCAACTGCSQLWKSSLEFKAQAGKLSAPAPSCSGQGGSQGGGQGDGQGPAAGLENIMFTAEDRIQCHLLLTSS